MPRIITVEITDFESKVIVADELRTRILRLERLGGHAELPSNNRLETFMAGVRHPIEVVRGREAIDIMDRVLGAE